MLVCVYSVFVLFCMYVAGLRRADPPSKESYRLCIGLGELKRKPRPNKRAVELIKEEKKVSSGQPFMSNCLKVYKVGARMRSWIKSLILPDPVHFSNAT
jgi:hypothetical protein